MDQSLTRRILQVISAEPGDEAKRWLRRADLQMEAARALADALPSEQTPGWDSQIAEAERLLAAINPADGLNGLKAAVQAAETAMEAIGRTAKTYRIHCVGHSHIDVNWMWSWPETVSDTHDTFASVLSLMHQYPDFTYSQSQGVVYALMERYFPDMFEEIKQRVKEGRWDITAAQWVEGDKNISSAESLCHHLLYTREFFQKHFDLTPEDVPVEWEPDTFGHALTIPSIVAQGAVKYYFSWRQGGGFGHERTGPARPFLYHWQGPDGTRVLVHRESYCYNTYFKLGENIALPLIGVIKETGLHECLKMYGVGNHGGGPTRAEIDYFHEMQDLPIYPQMVFSTTKAYFEAIEREVNERDISLPVVTGELNFENTGCYTSESLIKQANRFGENFLEEAEMLAALATGLAKRPYPAEHLREAWLKVLFNQFHDILPGSGIRETREHAMGIFQEVGAITGAIKRTASKPLLARIDTLSLLPDTPDAQEERALAEAGHGGDWEAGAGLRAGLTGLSQSRGSGKRFRAYVLYNPCAWTRTERVKVDLYDTGFVPERIVAMDEQGIKHPTLVLEREGEVFTWEHKRITVAFEARDVPALGYKTYLLHEDEITPGAAVVDAEAQGWFETPFFRLHVDPNHAGMLELTDKRSGARLVEPGQQLGAWGHVTERTHGANAWILGQEVDTPLTLLASSFGTVGVQFNGLIGSTLGGGPAGVEVIWHLAVPGTNSTVQCRMILHANEPRIDFEATVNWQEIGNPGRGVPGLTIRFPFAFSDTVAHYEVPFGSIERPLNQGEEVPALRYAHVSGKAKNAEGQDISAGITLVQDCKYGHSLHGNELRLRVVRSSFGPDPTPEIAETVMRYSLFFHDTEADPATLTRLGAAWNHPLIVFPTGLHTGSAPTQQEFVSVTAPNVVLSALKWAENGAGMVVRLVELNGQDTEATVAFDKELTQDFQTAESVDLLERPIGVSCGWETSASDKNRLHVKIKAHGFVTVLLSKKRG